jgi:hypothetical protein
VYAVKEKIADVIKVVLLFCVPKERHGFALFAAGERGERTDDVRVIGDEAG